MPNNESVRRNQLQMWLGFVGFFAVMAVISVVVTFLLGRVIDPLGAIVAAVLAVIFFVLLRRYRSLTAQR